MPRLTAPPATLSGLWHFFGIYYQVVPEGSPAGTTWKTGKPYTYDVNHPDGFVLLNPALRKRFVGRGWSVSSARPP